MVICDDMDVVLWIGGVGCVPSSSFHRPPHSLVVYVNAYGKQFSEMLLLLLVLIVGVDVEVDDAVLLRRAPESWRFHFANRSEKFRISKIAMRGCSLREHINNPLGGHHINIILPRSSHLVQVPATQ